MKHKLSWLFLIAQLFALPANSSTDNGMLLGMNLNWNADFDTPHRFANIVRSVTKQWKPPRNHGPYEADVKLDLRPSQPNDAFTLIIRSPNKPTNDFHKLVAGTYTIRWKGDARVKVTNFDNQNLMRFISGGEGTFTIDPDKTHRGLKVKAKGNLSDLEIIQPGMLASYDSGNEWSPDYISWLKGLNLQVLRFMDLTNTNGNLREYWSERTTPDYASWNLLEKPTREKERGHVPYEVLVDLANQLNIDPWFNIPHRADLTKDINSGENFVYELSSYVKTNLNKNLTPYYELGNEVWNSKFINTAWFANLQRASNYHEAKYNHKEKLFTKTAHGLNQNDQINILKHKDNHPKKSTGSASWGIKFVHVVNADQFQVKDKTGKILKLGPGATMAAYILPGDDTIESNIHKNYASQVDAMWEILDQVHGPDNYYKLIAAQAANKNTIKKRLSALKKTPDFVALAPYTNGESVQMGADLSSQSVRPKIWMTRANTHKKRFPVYASVYLKNSSPTFEQVEKGSGNGFVGSAGSLVFKDNKSWDQFDEITGLDETKAYEIWYALSGPFGEQLVGPLAFNLASTATEVRQMDNFDNQVFRDRYDADKMLARLKSYKALLPDKTRLINYESGRHFFPAKMNPESGEAKSWLYDYYGGQQHANVMKYAIENTAKAGVAAYLYYKDISVTNWHLTRDINNTEPAYKAFASFQGLVNVQ